MLHMTLSFQDIAQLVVDTDPRLSVIADFDPDSYQESANALYDEIAFGMAEQYQSQTEDVDEPPTTPLEFFLYAAAMDYRRARHRAKVAAALASLTGSLSQRAVGNILGVSGTTVGRWSAEDDYLGMATSYHEMMAQRLRDQHQSITK